MNHEDLQMIRKAVSIAHYWAAQVRASPHAYWDWESDTLIHSPTERSFYEDYKEVVKWATETGLMEDA